MEVPGSQPIEQVLRQGYRFRVWVILKSGWKIFLLYPSGFLALGLFAEAVEGSLQIWLPAIYRFFGGIFEEIILSCMALGVWRIIRGNDCQIKDFLPAAAIFQRLFIYSLILTCFYWIFDFPWYFIGSSFEENISTEEFWSRFKLTSIYAAGLIFLFFCSLLVVFTPLLILDREASLREGFVSSAKIVNKNKWGIVRLYLALMGIGLCLVFVMFGSVEWVNANFDILEIFPILSIGNSPFLEALGEAFSRFNAVEEINLGVWIIQKAFSGVILAIMGCMTPVAYAHIMGLSQNKQYAS